MMWQKISANLNQAAQQLVENLVEDEESSSSSSYSSSLGEGDEEYYYYNDTTTTTNTTTMDKNMPVDAGGSETTIMEDGNARSVLLPQEYDYNVGSSPSNDDDLVAHHVSSSSSKAAAVMDPIIIASDRRSGAVHADVSTLNNNKQNDILNVGSSSTFNLVSDDVVSDDMNYSVNKTKDHHPSSSSKPSLDDDIIIKGNNNKLEILEEESSELVVDEDGADDEAQRVLELYRSLAAANNEGSSEKNIDNHQESQENSNFENSHRRSSSSIDEKTDDHHHHHCETVITPNHLNVDFTVNKETELVAESSSSLYATTSSNTENNDVENHHHGEINKISESEQLVNTMQINYAEQTQRLLQNHYAELEQERAQSKKLAQNITELVETNNLLTKSKKIVENEVQDLKAQLNQERDRAQAAEQRLQSFLQKIEKDHDTKKSNHIAQVQEYQILTQQQRGEMERLRSVISELQMDNEQQDSQLEKYRKELSKSQNEVSYLQKTIEESNHKISTLYDSLNAAKEENSAVGGLRMELQMLKEAKERESNKNEEYIAASSTSLREVAASRDSYKQELEDTKRQLVAVKADLELSRSDVRRATESYDSLHKVLVSLQAEKDSEAAYYEQLKEDALSDQDAVHKVALASLAKSNEIKMKEIQQAADAAVRNTMEEFQSMDDKITKLQKENISLHRSLDEAVRRLQNTQEDVVDRETMKQILLDWHIKFSGRDRNEVLAVMTSLLHFTEEEKRKVGVAHDDMMDQGTVRRLYGALAAPLPPAVVKTEELQGDNLREKWVNFLLAETGDANEKGSEV